MRQVEGERDLPFTDNTRLPTGGLDVGLPRDWDEIGQRISFVFHPRSH